MTRKHILPGELFIAEYVDGVFRNRWAINASNQPIIVGQGRKVAAGVVDVMIESDDPKVALIDSRYHIVSNREGMKLVTDVALGDVSFAEVALKVLKVEKETGIYNRSGVQIGTIPAGSLIATKDADAGNSKRFLMVANAFNDGTGYKFVNQKDYSYGFVNVQEGFGLKEHDPKRNLVTAVSYEGPKIDWALVKQVVEAALPEAILRGDISQIDAEELRTLVKSHFAKIDLEDEELMNPIPFFTVPEQRDFVIRELAKVNTAQANAFEEAALEFTGEV